MSLSWSAVLGALLVACGCGTRRVTIPVLPPLLERPTEPVLWHEPFDHVDPSRWREIEVKGQTTYEVVTVDGRSCLRAESRGGASILLAPLRFNPDKYEWLSWDWRVERHVDGEDLKRKQGSDAAARVYVYFDTPGLPWQRRNLDYVWSAVLPFGTLLSSAFSPTSKILVADSGPASGDGWRRVQRNLEEDYERVFGGHPPDVVAIGLMTDADNTGTHAVAYFDDMRISRTPPRPPHKAGK